MNSQFRFSTTRRTYSSVGYFLANWRRHPSIFILRIYKEGRKMESNEKVFVTHEPSYNYIPVFLQVS